MERNQAFLLILASSFLILLIYLLPVTKESDIEKSLDVFQHKVEVIVAGDVMLGRSVMGVSLKTQNNPNYPFEKIGETLKNADLTFINLESPFVDNCPFVNSGLTFCADPKMVSGLKFAGIDVATLANNHTKNYGEEGLINTSKILEENGIKAVGLDNLVIQTKRGTKFGFLGFDFTLKREKQADLDLVKDSKNKVDILIVSVHWGEEYQAKANKIQREIARKLVEAGADIVVGHHPHWVQDEEHINGKPVYYSLGNLVFDQMWSEATKKGLLVKLTFENKKLVGEEKLPIYIEKLGQPILRLP